MELDGSHGFARRMWDALADGAVWTIPRTGLIYTKDEEAKTLTLTFRMPWFDGLSVDADGLKAAQDEEHETVGRVFGVIGVEVREIDASEYPLGFCRYCYRARFIEEVEQEEPMLEGRCTQCVREGVTEPMTPFSL